MSGTGATSTSLCDIGEPSVGGAILDCLGRHLTGKASRSRVFTGKATIPMLAVACLSISCHRPETFETRIQKMVLESTEGNVGVLLVDVRRGATLVDINSGFPFEPASTIKPLHLLLALRAMRSGAVSESTPISTYLGTIGESCPASNGEFVVDRLDSAIKLMMIDSDNRRTRSITEYFGGFGTLNQLAKDLGMASTQVVHHIGCGYPPNHTTLRDLERLFATLFDAEATASATPFAGCIDTQYKNGGYADGRLWGLVYNESKAVGLSEGALVDFCRLLVVASKRGNYALGDKHDESWVAHVRVPRQEGGHLDSDCYFVAGFVSGSRSADGAHNKACHLATEVLRDVIRLALDTWR